MSEQTAGISGYQFSGNNPISFNDPMGDKFLDPGSPGTGPNVWHHADGLAGTLAEGMQYQQGFGYDGFGGASGGGPGGGGGQAATKFGYDSYGRYGYWLSFTQAGTGAGNGLLSGVVVGTRFVQLSSFIDGNYSNQDLINIGISFMGANLSTMQALAQNEYNAVKVKGITNGMNSYYRRGLKNLEGAVDGFSKYGKKLGIAGIALTAGNLAYKYETTGITRKDAVDATISGVLLLVTITNPVGLIAVGAYGLLDSFGVFDGIKESLGIDDTIIAQH